MLAVTEVSLRIAAQEVVCIVGLSGSAKSTTLYNVSGSAKPTPGEVMVGGAKVKGRHKQVALMPQKYLLMP